MATAAPFDSRQPTSQGDAVLPVYDAAGVDRTLIRWMLSLTPTERLKFLQSSVDMLASARPLPDEPR